MVLQVVTANRLDNGIAVFYGSDGEWYSSIGQANRVESGENSEALLEQASGEKNQLLVVGPYLIDVTEENGQVEPVRYREKIRTLGPSVRPDLGYQAK